MLELAGENPFKVRAYENGAKALFAFSGDFPAAVASRELRKTPGIGAGLFANIETLVRTGSLRKLGYIATDERVWLNEIYDYNPLLFDFVLKRTLKIPGTEQRLPASIFMANQNL